MWAMGVRWAVVEKYTTFSPPSQHALFAGPYDALISRPDIARLAAYNSRLSAVSRQTFDDGEFTVYRLDYARLMEVTGSAPSIPAQSRPAVTRALAALAAGDKRTAALEATTLYRLGVRMVTLSFGELGSIPELTAYGQSMSNSDTVGLPVTSGRWVVNCLPACYVAPSPVEIERLGRVLHDDGRFSTIVALRPPAGRT
jgi:hypothetical protein